MLALENRLKKITAINAADNMVRAAEFKAYGNNAARADAYDTLKQAVEDYTACAPLGDVIYSLQIMLGELKDIQIVKKYEKLEATK